MKMGLYYLQERKARVISGGPRIEIPLNMRIQAFYDGEPRLAQLAIDNSVGISCDTLKEGRKREADMKK